MKKIIFLLSVLFSAIWTFEGFAQIAGDGSYFWNSTSITFGVNNKTDVYFGNKDHFSNQINRLDYFHFELIGYRKISQHFSMGLGARQTENYRTNKWNGGQSYMLYGIYYLNPGNLKIKFANRLVAKVAKSTDTQHFFDNITTIDFFARSTNSWPKPYLMDELFSSLDLGKLQTIRLYGGIHLFSKKHWGLDLYYCYLKTRSTASWKDYNVLGINTRVKI